MQEPSGCGKWLLYVPKYDSSRTVTVGNNVLALLKRTLEFQLTNKETCGEYYQENYMNYDEETHSLLSLNDLRPVHFVNAKQGGLLAHPRNMQHTSRSMVKQRTVLLSVKNGTSTVYDILMQQFFMRQVFQCHWSRKDSGILIFRQQNATQIMLLRKCFLCLMK